MSNQPLSQNLDDYDAQTRAKIEQMIEEDKEDRKKFAARVPDSTAVLLGGAGAPGSITDAT